MNGSIIMQFTKQVGMKKSSLGCELPELKDTVGRKSTIRTNWVTKICSQALTMPTQQEEHEALRLHRRHEGNQHEPESFLKIPSDTG